MTEWESIGSEAELQRSTLEKAEGSYLPESLVERQAELVALGPTEIARRLADMVIAAALCGYATSPERVLRALLAGYKISDESWYEVVAPELRRVLGARGVELSALEGPPPAEPPLPEPRVAGLPAEEQT